MSEEKKIKIGKIFQKIGTLMFILFFIDTVLIYSLIETTVYIVSVLVIAAIFIICGVVSYICLKNYDPKNEPEKKKRKKSR